jgi:class 3 adenylate cyclase/TolB-like protein
MGETRKLAAILVADVVGYSRLAGADEDRTLARLRGLRSDLIDPAIAAHHGRIVKRTGDGAIVEFRSVVDAVRCAIEVQNGLIERNFGLPLERRIEYRVGIHLGDVVEENDGDLMGDGVNIAARLEQTAKPGGICLSEDAYRHVKQRLDLKVVDLGETQLKNITEPIRVYSLEAGERPEPGHVATKAAGIASVETKNERSEWSSSLIFRQWAIAAALAVLIVAAGTYALRGGFAERPQGAWVAEDKLAHAPRLSIAVLPFENLGGDPEQEYFAEGVTDDLTTDLSHLEGSFVIARTTMSTYKGKPVDAKAIGREIGVRYVLEGSVHRVGDTITVNAQLISTETGAHVWADRFDGERGELGRFQTYTVARIANSLAAELVRAESLRATRERPNNLDAVDLVMQAATAYSGGWSPAKLSEATGYYERALQLNPDLVPAQVGLAQALVARARLSLPGHNAEDLVRADSLIERALSTESSNAWAHLVKAELAFTRRQFDVVLSESQVALENDPNFAGAYALQGGLNIFLGRAAETIPYEETALRLSPREPDRNFWEHWICHAHAHLAQWEKAAEWCGKSIATNPSFWIPYVDLAAAYGWLGRDTEARTAIAGLHKLIPDFTVKDWANIVWSDDPQFQREDARIIEGLLKAGLPEGKAKSN